MNFVEIIWQLHHLVLIIYHKLHSIQLFLKTPYCTSNNVRV